MAGSWEHDSGYSILFYSILCYSILFYSIPLAYAECDDSLPFSAASSIPLCYIRFPATLVHQLFFHPPSLHLTTYFLIYLLVLLFPNSCTILSWEFYFLPFCVHAQTNVIYVALLSLFGVPKNVEFLRICLIIWTITLLQVLRSTLFFIWSLSSTDITNVFLYVGLYILMICILF
jgi:hypothetical protein